MCWNSRANKHTKALFSWGGTGKATLSDNGFPIVGMLFNPRTFAESKGKALDPTMNATEVHARHSIIFSSAKCKT